MSTRTVRVPRARLAGWVERFAARHGHLTPTADSATLLLPAADGAEAVLTVPFLPWTPGDDPLAALLDHVARDRTVGVLLARRGGHAAGVFVGEELVASKVGSGYVQGRTKAGGWSQQRYARRRANQAAKAVEDA
ncbi:acVLRF1 family peptidyl-tRNA hydrolase, partial [Desertihabitans aurantiacus]|uniref:acVLRF1 family peptidyl-tRNA hydrolase n=1 Tax=Desertihabitans aurantiacus TaxID=2282477 RepID=UPI0022B7E617